ncbi:thyroid adenoma-associated protein homolog isoform X2 [Calliopsis andreniformis]|uniref:thyroid adenoma-associated protein homolog isoform X2 n=1 Tax=Calliopsis andreniformis TaxID=337506 RepID=UPI003FCC7CCF
MSTREEIKGQLKELLALKRSGELDSEEKLNSDDDHLWRGYITYDRLENCVQHRDDEIKLNTLALIIESKKNTLRFTCKELDIIVLFLRVNLKEKLEFVPLIKKALKRMKDSLAVMRRQCIQEEKMRNWYEKNCNSLKYGQEVLDESRRMLCELEMDINKYFCTFQSLHNMCICEPDATYYRRRSSLEILLLMRDLLDNEFKHIIWNAEQVKALFNLLLLDTYESNKEMAFNLIKSIDPVLLQLDNESHVYNIIIVAIELGNSIRPIDSVTATYMLKVSMLSPVIQNILENCFDLTKWSENVTEATVLQLVLILLKKLKDSLIGARENIVMTVTKHSLYGYLFCIRSLLLECNIGNVGKNYLWQSSISELVDVCFELSYAVSFIVNNSSPEGHLPMDLNLQTIHELCNLSSEKQVVTPQMVLLCSWRTVKEISLLFGFLSTNATICKDNCCMGLLNENQIIRIGEHLVTLLTETKHRGAFEQTYVGFRQLCAYLWRSNRIKLNQLPIRWLHQILIMVTGLRQENSKLCATRRSAGFTELQSINLWGDIKQLIYRNSVFSEYENTVEFSKCNDDQYISENTIRVIEIKIHALNILRAIFRHSHLAEVVDNYAEAGLIAAFKSYDAVTWAERNAATLLFSALVVRIFGVQRTKDHINLTTDNKMNYRVFFERYSSLLPFILDELQKFAIINNVAIKSNVQSILLLLSRLYHCYNSESINIEWKISNLIGLVIQCSNSPIYETRKLAARALAALLTEQSATRILTELIENIIKAEKCHPSLNLIHGYMLQILEILKQFQLRQYQLFNVDWDKFVKKTTWILKDLERESSNSPCFLLATAYINICHEIHKGNKMCMNQHHRLLHTLVPHLVKGEKLKQGPAQDEYMVSVLKFLHSVAKESILISENLSVSIYSQSLVIPETRVVAWSAITDIINEMSSTISLPLLKYAVNLIYDSKQDIHRYNPEVQDAMFNFLYNSLTFLNQSDSSCVRNMDIGKFVLNDLRSNDNENLYRERDSYLRLLGQSYVTIVSLIGDAHTIDQECINDIYNSFCDNLWIASLNTNLRTSVFRIMEDLFLICYKNKEDRFVQVQWWTTVLQLLLDNNPEVRHEALTLIEHIPIDCLLNKTPSYINLFLTKFYAYMCNKDPEFICVVLFCWSISLQKDTVYEMDETDVFDRCTNYDFFEPLELSKSCATFLTEHTYFFIDTVLSDCIIDWANSRLNVEFIKSISFRTLLKNYENYIPALEERLQDTLDPMYKCKLLHVLAYREFSRILLEYDKL